MLSVHVPPRATAECQESASAYPSSAEYTPHQQGLELASMQKQPRAVPNAHSPSFLNHHHRVRCTPPGLQDAQSHFHTLFSLVNL